MGEKFLGLGLKNLIGVSLVVMGIIIVTKVVFTKHPVAGVSELVQSI